MDGLLSDAQGLSIRKTWQSNRGKVPLTAEFPTPYSAYTSTFHSGGRRAVAPCNFEQPRGQHVSSALLRVPRLPATLGISAIVLLILLFFPGSALGVQTVTTSVGGTAFPLGSQIPATVTIDLTADEFLGLDPGNKATITLDIVGTTGGQDVTFNLPLVAGPFTVGVNGSTFSGDVTHAQIDTDTFTGYGYGYKAQSGGGTITIAGKFQHRILLDPAPLNLPELPSIPTCVSIVPGAEGVRISYDHYSHHSGKLRAMVQCRNHDKCRKDINVTDFDSREQASAHLIAWHLLGESIPANAAVPHRVLPVPADLTESCKHLQFSG